MATITSLNFHILARYSGDNAFRRARNDIQQTERAAGGMNSSLARSGRLFVTLARSAALATPALGIFYRAIVASAGALVSLGAMLAVTGGLFVGLAITAAKNAKDMGVWGARFTKSVNGVKSAWMSLARATAPATLRPMVTILNATRQAIGQLRPLILATAPAFQDFANKIAHFLTSASGFGRFLTTMKTYGVPALHSMLNASFSLFQVLIRGVEAFAPLGLLMARLIERGAAALARWANHGGFDRFVATVQLNGPLIAGFFRALGPAIGNVFRALGMLAPVLHVTSTLFLYLATFAAKVIAAMPPGLILAIALAWQIWAMRVRIFFIWMRLVAIWGGIVRVATLMWAAAQWILNAALLANPITWIILAILALAAIIVVIALKTTWFQTIWHYVWIAIKAVVQFVWTVLKIIFNFLVMYYTKWLPAAALFVWHAMVAAWHAIWNGIKFVYHWLAANVFGPIVHWFTTFIPHAASFLWHGIVGAWHAIVSGLSAAYHWMASNIFGPIVHWFTTFIPGAARAVWHAIVGAWNAVSRGVSAAYHWVARNVFGPMVRWFTKFLPEAGRTVWHALVFAFTKARDGIKWVWDKLKAILKAPISFFVNVIYNRGIVPAWNNTIGKIPGVPHLPRARGFARGGYVSGIGGPTGDKIPAMLSDGEYVIRARAARKIGYDKLDMLNNNSAGAASHKAGPAYLAKGGKPKPKGGGGILDSIGGFFKGAVNTVGGALGDAASWIGGAVKKGFNWAEDFTISVAGGIVRKLFQPARNLLTHVKKKWGSTPANRLGGGGANIVYGAGNAALDALMAFAESKAIDDVGGGGFAMGLQWARSQVGKKYQWGGNGNPSWDCSGFISAIESVVRGQKPHRRWATGAFGGKGPDGWHRNMKSPFMIGITNRGKGHTAGTLNNVNVECAGGVGCRVGPKARGYKDRMFQSVWGFDPKKAAGGGKSGNWTSVVLAVLKALGEGNANLPFVLKAIMKESGGNAHAVNKWDSNARAGHPSKGLLQVIQPTFNRYAGKYRSRGIMDPFANIYAAIAYARARYGRHWQRRMAAPGGYAEGGMVAASYDRGGYLPEGLSLAYNGTGRPEPVGHGLGTDIHFHGNVYVKSEREFRDMVIEAVAEAKRRKRV